MTEADLAALLSDGEPEPGGEDSEEQFPAIYKLARITLTNGEWAITRVPPKITVADLPQLPEAGVLPDDLPDALKPLFLSQEQQHREEIVDTMIAATKAGPLERVTIMVTAAARDSNGWFGCFDTSDRNLTIQVINIASIRLLSDDEADRYPRARHRDFDKIKGVHTS